MRQGNQKRGGEERKVDERAEEERGKCEGREEGTYGGKTGGFGRMKGGEKE